MPAEESEISRADASDGRSLREAVAWLGDTITIRSATRLLQLAQPDKKREWLG
jgi:hypothetical protein